MSKYRKRPLVIEAVQFTGEMSIPEITFLMQGTRNLSWDREMETLDIETLEGVMTADRGDWIIKGIRGECYPCKPDIFEETYVLEEE